jgi:acetyl esterase/lipase
MVLLGSLLLGALGGCASFTSSSRSTVHPGRPLVGYTEVKDVIYTPPGWPKALPASLYLPNLPGPHPAVLLLYGGAWSDQDHRWQMTFIARKLARRGYVVMSATYRGVPEYIYSAPVADVHEALKWLRTHAADYQVEPNRIAAYGYSAGANLAALLGTSGGPASDRVQAVVAGGTPADLTYHPGGDLVPRYLGGTYAQIPETYRDASPVFHVAADDPPFFLYYGTDDHLVDPENTRRLKAALDRVGVTCEVYPLEGHGHMGTLIFGGPAEDAAIDFLDRAL